MARFRLTEKRTQLDNRPTPSDLLFYRIKSVIKHTAIASRTPSPTRHDSGMADMRSFALIPAAGYGRRMVTPKLLLEFRGRPLIDHALQAWVASQVDQVIV